MRKWVSLLLVIICLCMVIDTGNATIQLKFNSINLGALSENFSNVHFNGAGNNFWGGIFWFNAKSVDSTNRTQIRFSSNQNNYKTCYKVVRGIYYNSQRGNRIWPLDQDTLSLLQLTNNNYNGLIMEWGLYTACEWTDNKYSIFWRIKYTQNGTTSYVIAGTKLKYAQNTWSGEFAQSFQYFDNKTPLGYIRDSYGGIGFVGGELSGSNNLIAFLNNGWIINSGFTYLNSGSSVITVPSRAQTLRTFNQTGNSALNTMWNIIIQGTIWLSNNISETDRASIIGNQQGNSTIFNSSITNADISNQAKQYSEKICKGRRDKLNQDIQLQASTENTLCYKGNGLALEINVAQESRYQNKTIVMQDGHIVLTGNMQANSPSLDLFVDGGNLYIPKRVASNNLTYFDTQGFPVTNGGTGVNAGLFVKGNIVINWLLIGGSPSNGSIIENKTHIQGKFFSLNTPFEETTKRQTQIASLLKTSNYEEFINLQKLFTRQCGLDGVGSDGITSCTNGNDIGRVSLVILDRAFPSRLLK